MPEAIEKALKSARAFVERLCANRRKFCDDGTPQRYHCGEKNQRRDRVTITVWMDNKAIAVLRGTKEGQPLLRDLDKIKRHPETTECCPNK